MFVCCECCVLSGRGLCDELITRPEESYRLWCVVVCDLENLLGEETETRVGPKRHRGKKKVLPAMLKWSGVPSCMKRVQYFVCCIKVKINLLRKPTLYNSRNYQFVSYYVQRHVLLKIGCFVAMKWFHVDGNLPTNVGCIISSYFLILQDGWKVFVVGKARRRHRESQVWPDTLQG